MTTIQLKSEVNIDVNDLIGGVSQLTRFEKLQLIEAISKMLLEEESPQKYLAPDSTYPLFTPLHQEKAASQLQQFLDQQPR